VEFAFDRGSARWLWSGLRHRAANRALAIWPGAPFEIALRAFSRYHAELLRAVQRQNADLFYGGTSGGLAVAALAARSSGVRYALDLEDFHDGEQPDDQAGRAWNRLAGRIESVVLRGAAFRTVSSDAIGSAYAEAHAVDTVTIHNVCARQKADLPLQCEPGVLRVCWFSQTIGPGRGLEEAVRAFGAAGVRGTLSLRGRPAAGFVDLLSEQARRVAPLLELVIEPMVPPDDLTVACSRYDVGLALENANSINNHLALSNKALTYAAAGLALVMTDSPGQQELARDLGEGARVVPRHDVAALAAVLRDLAEDVEALTRARRAALEGARRRWHWEHPAERGALLNAVERSLQ
jgi:glycosyltransferase involved in cell wall biosynthesis